MGRFSDQWVVDKTLFEFINGGSCACCGFAALFAPGGLKGMIEACSDIDTDGVNAELDAVKRSPWPPEMRDDVWAGRVKLRLKMKREMKKYSNFFKTACEGNEGGHPPDLGDLYEFCMDTMGEKELMRMFQMPRAEISEILDGYEIHGSFSVVLTTVSEQVANYKATGYGVDSKGVEEANLEAILSYDRRGGFILPIESAIRQNVLDQVLKIFLTRMKSLGGPKLLERGKSKSVKNGEGKQITDADDLDDDNLDHDSALDISERYEGPSFQMDRRIIRLLIAKYWADRLIERYNSAQAQLCTNSELTSDELDE